MMEEGADLHLAIKTVLERQQSAVDCTQEEYVERFQVDELLGRLRNRLIAAKPHDPVRFLSAELQHKDRSDSDIFSFWQPAASPRAEIDLAEPVGMDIGGTLTKITLLERKNSQDQNIAEFVKDSLTYGSTGVRDPHLSFDCDEGTLHFIRFETARMETAVNMLVEQGVLQNQEVIFATGGGAQKYSEMLSRSIGCEVVKGDELSCLLVGLNFLLRKVPDECFYLEDIHDPANSAKIPVNVSDGQLYPYLLVNIGSGVSILLINDERSFQRVSGTTIGGGTYLGLCKLLTKCSSFREAMELSVSGDNTAVDMLVGDIYGGDYEAFNLSADTVASSFGKLVRPRDKTPKPEDIAASLLQMIGINIAQLAHLCAMRLRVNRIIFAGSFLRHNPKSMGSLSFSIDYWSKGERQALFLKHEGYCGSVGALLMQNVLYEVMEEKEDPN